MPDNYVASSVRFSDDTLLNRQPLFDVEDVVGSNGLTGKSGDDRDKFLISRLNDETSYFYTWFCKRFKFTLKSNRQQEISCPICLESELNSIELQCGHSFCRSCLTASAEMKISACPMCRANIVINPQVLKQKFEEKRIQNLMCRLQNVETQEVVDPFVEKRSALSRCKSIDLTSPSRISQRVNTGKKFKEQRIITASAPQSELLRRNVGSLSLHEMRTIYNESLEILTHNNKSRFEPPKLSKCIFSSTDADLREALLSNIGALPLVDLSATWTNTFNIGLSKMSVGAESIRCMKRRWTRQTTIKDSTDKNKKTWLKVERLAKLPSDVGCESVDDLKHRWRQLYVKGIGAKHPLELKDSWDKLKSKIIPAGQPIPSKDINGQRNAMDTIEIGGKERKELELSFKKLSNLASTFVQRGENSNEGTFQDVGSYPQESLKHKWQVALQSNDIGSEDLKSISKRWEYYHKFSLPDDIGDLPIHVLKSRFATVTRKSIPQQQKSDAFGPKSSNIGELDNLELQERFTKTIQLSLSNNISDVGDLHTDDLRSKFQHASLCNSVGGAPLHELKKSWKQGVLAT